MDERLKSALDKVRAEESLVEHTASRIAEVSRRSKRRSVIRFRLAAACAALLIALSLGGLSLNLYFTPSAYIDLDVNPSIELTLNRFGRVIQGSAYNEDGERVLDEVNVRHLDYASALDRLIGAMASDGYIVQDGLVSVTVQGSEIDSLLPQVRASVDEALSAHHLSIETDVFTVSQEIKAMASQHHLSPAKYLAITELQFVDPSATMDGCRDHSISEIRQFAHAHTVHHESDNAVPSETATATTSPEDEHEDDAPSPMPEPTIGSVGHAQNNSSHHSDHH